MGGKERKKKRERRIKVVDSRNGAADVDETASPTSKRGGRGDSLSFSSFSDVQPSASGRAHTQRRTTTAARRKRTPATMDNAHGMKSKKEAETLQHDQLLRFPLFTPSLLPLRSAKAGLGGTGLSTSGVFPLCTQLFFFVVVWLLRFTLPSSHRNEERTQ